MSEPVIFQGRTFFLHRNKDGTETPWAEGTEGAHEAIPQGTNEGICTGRYLDTLTALQIGMWLILQSLKITTIDRRALVDTGRVESNSTNFQRLFLDFPDAEDDQVPNLSATIMAEGVQDLALSGPLSATTKLFESTVDVYEKNTVLQYLYDLETTIAVVSFTSSKDLRAGVAKSIIEGFHEPDSDTPGRRVIVPWYYDRIARFDLQSIEYDDGPENSRGNRYPLIARFAADIEAVKLVTTPPSMQPKTSVSTTTETLS